MIDIIDADRYCSSFTPLKITLRAASSERGSDFATYAMLCGVRRRAAAPQDAIATFVGDLYDPSSGLNIPLKWLLLFHKPRTLLTEFGRAKKHEWDRPAPFGLAWPYMSLERV